MRRSALTLYLNPSLVVAALSNEPMTRQVRQWLVKLDPDRLVISDWTIIEISPATAITLRTRQIDLALRAAVLGVPTKLQA